MPATETRQSKLSRLACRIAGGEVVFFIGAGFSLDSEQNTAKALIARLLCRFEALTSHLSKCSDTAVAEMANRLRGGLRRTFSLQDKTLDEIFANMGGLAQNYYLINDWMCSAFENLLDAFTKLPPAPDAVLQINTAETELYRRFRAIEKFSNAAPPPAIDFPWLIDLRRQWLSHPDARRDRALCGKVLFLETLGFNCREVMGGHPALVRLRHHVLARLAAEGLSPTLVTTNYDLLIECAYRENGMEPLHPNDWPSITVKQPLNRRFRYFSRIAEASQFFTRGDARGAALVHKIHGCVDTYRIRRKENDAAAFRNFLSTIVFTFREIQNWREDSWSRDYLSTLLRTRTIVFSGYSGADPVLHDTFRTVYEEMAGYRGGAEDGGARTGARAFFFDLEDKREFYGLEILRAASAAAGEPSTELTDHPNLITFHYTDQDFPGLDELYCWLYHLCFRELEKQTLESDLRRIAYQLFDRPCPEDDAKRIAAAFDQLRSAENEVASGFDGASSVEARLDFRRLAAWTQGFHLSLMREFELAETLLSSAKDRAAIPLLARGTWYRPVSEHPQWAAWGVVLELAIRRAVSSLQGQPDAWTTSGPLLEAAAPANNGEPPTVLYAASPRNARTGGAFVRRAIRIECQSVRGLLARSPRPRQFGAIPPAVWELGAAAAPWWSTADKRRPANTPGPRQLWSWATGSTEGIEEYFGEAARVEQRKRTA